MSTSLRHILDKMDNSDSDYRYMASSDLLQQLQSSSLQADGETQKRLSRSVLKLLKDTNSEVQGMAMRCLAPLTAFVSVSHSEYIVDKLLDHVLASTASKPRVGGPENVSIKAMRDVSSLALKSILSGLVPDSVKSVNMTAVLTPRIIHAIRSTKADGDDAEILIETLELLHDALIRMGGSLLDLHAEISDALYRQLPSPSPLIAKRAISCIGVLAAKCDNALFESIVEKTIADLQAEDSHETIEAGVQILWALSKTSGHRLSVHVRALAPLLFNFISSEKYEEDDELREHCLQTLASFCARCRREMAAFGNILVTCVLKLAKYDPNYAACDEEDNPDDSEEQMGADEDYPDEFDDEDDYSDDDDSSWKVRRAAIRCLQSAISVELLPRHELCGKVGPFLVTRFKEREEAVRLDVFDAFSELLILCSNQQHGIVLPKDSISINEGAKDPMSVDLEDECRTELKPLLSCTSQIMRNIQKELSSRSLKTRIKATAILRDLVKAMPSAISPFIETLMPEIERGLRDDATAMKTESLLLLRSVVHRGGAEALKQSVEPLIKRVLAATDDRYYKVTAECLRFCAEVLVAFGTSSSQCVSKMTPLVPFIHEAALRRVTAQDQDSEVKDAALQCLGASVSYFGSVLGPDRLETIAVVLCDRLENEVTRIATVRALHSIALSKEADVLMPVMNEISAVVSGFLRKNNPVLKAAALEFLYVAPALPADRDASLLANVSELITDSNLRLACMALQLASRLLELRGAGVIEELSRDGSVYSKALALTASPLLQGRTASALIALFRTLAQVDASPLGIAYLMESLTSLAESVSSNLATSSARNVPLHCIAKCIVAVCDSSRGEQRKKIYERVIAHVDSSDIKDRVFSLICVGELGRSSKASEGDMERVRLREAVLLALEAPQDEVRTAAALALGGITSADGASGVPDLVRLIKEKPEQRYLLLLSLKDALASSTCEDLRPVVQLLLPFLLQQPISSAKFEAHAASRDSAGRGKLVSEEESVRTATAECLGLLMHSAPEVVLNALKDGTASEHSDVRASIAAAVKFGISSTTSDVSALSASLSSCIDVFIALINDVDVNVAKNALHAVNAVAKSSPLLLVPHMGTVLERVSMRLSKDKEHVRIVDLGPFKHEEDYGLDMRKSAFDCIRTFISGPLCAHLQLTTVIERVLVGLADQSDVRAIAQLILATAAASPSASELANIIEPIVKALKVTFSEKVKQNAVRQEAERHDDSIRGAMRAVKMLETVPEISGNRYFQSFLSDVVRAGRFSEMYDAIGQDDVQLMAFSGVTGPETSNAKNLNDVEMSDK